MIYDGSSATYRLKTIFSVPLPIMILWRVRIISQVATKALKQASEPQSLTQARVSTLFLTKIKADKAARGQHIFFGKNVTTYSRAQKVLHIRFTLCHLCLRSLISGVPEPNSTLWGSFESLFFGL